MAGTSGAGPITKFDPVEFPVKFACEVKDFDPLSFLDKKEARRMGAFTHFALAASDEAMKHSGLVIDESNADMVEPTSVRALAIFGLSSVSTRSC